MGYVIKTGAGVWRPVRWEEAVDNGGVETQEISIKFRRVGLAEAVQIDSDIKAGTLQLPELATRVILDWDPPSTSAGPLAFTPDNLALLADAPGFLGAFELAFWKMVGGLADERVKNSPASLAGGPAAGEATHDPLHGTTA